MDTILKNKIKQISPYTRREVCILIQVEQVLVSLVCTHYQCWRWLSFTDDVDNKFKFNLHLDVKNVTWTNPQSSLFWKNSGTNILNSRKGQDDSLKYKILSTLSCCLVWHQFWRDVNYYSHRFLSRAQERKMFLSWFTCTSVVFNYWQ